MVQQTRSAQWGPEARGSPSCLPLVIVLLSMTRTVARQRPALDRRIGGHGGGGKGEDVALEEGIGVEGQCHPNDPGLFVRIV